ncbi:hypothetical protein [Pseudomonas mediterranea]|uniref:hypothetical protein n=1 Tax=Pseudomonas mediterranea TaxID=183795 RepID=UPI0006D89EEE|nr:hypothetical protein [Pseudomonas mediterranea]
MFDFKLEDLYLTGEKVAVLESDDVIYAVCTMEHLCIALVFTKRNGWKYLEEQYYLPLGTRE